MGVVVIETHSGCPETVAAINPGDIIIDVNKKKIISEKDWYIERSKFKPRQTITLKIKRKMKGVISEKIKSVIVRLSEIE